MSVLAPVMIPEAVSQNRRNRVFRPEGTALSKPRARQGEFHEPVAALGSRSHRT